MIFLWCSISFVVGLGVARLTRPKTAVEQLTRGPVLVPEPECATENCGSGRDPRCAAGNCAAHCSSAHGCYGTCRHVWQQKQLAAIGR